MSSTHPDHPAGATQAQSPGSRSEGLQPGSFQLWRDAMRRALYGETGFFRRNRPADHFRTSPHVSPAFAEALLRLLDSAGLDCVLDVGAGGGELLATLARLRPGLRLIGVEIADRPARLPAEVSWRHRLGEQEFSRTLLVANEWLDNVPVDVATLDRDGNHRLVAVRASRGLPAGNHLAERLGPAPDPDQLAWLRRWWPLDTAPPDTRAEIGLERDRAWAAAVGALRDGLVLAIDYGHTAATRPPAGTLCGWRHGRPTAPHPDGTADITAHVAIDAVREAGERAGASTLSATTQRDALLDLGVAGTRPSLEMAQQRPREYLAELARGSAAAELLNPSGLGGYHWLLQSVDRRRPRSDPIPRRG